MEEVESEKEELKLNALSSTNKLFTPLLLLKLCHCLLPKRIHSFQPLQTKTTLLFSSPIPSQLSSGELTVLLLPPPNPFAASAPSSPCPVPPAPPTKMKSSQLTSDSQPAASLRPPSDPPPTLSPPRSTLLRLYSTAPADRHTPSSYASREAS